MPDWFQNKHVEEKEIDTETSVALKKRLENLKKKRPEKNSRQKNQIDKQTQSNSSKPIKNNMYKNILSYTNLLYLFKNT